MCSHVLNFSFIINPAIKENLLARQELTEIPPMGHGKPYTLLWSIFLCVIANTSFLTCLDEIVSTVSAIRCPSKIASVGVIHKGMLDLMMNLTPSSPDLMSTQDEILTALIEDVEIHICNDGFLRDVEMFFKSLARWLTLALEPANIEGDVEAQANLSTVEVEKEGFDGRTRLSLWLSTEYW